MKPISKIFLCIDPIKITRQKEYLKKKLSYPAVPVRSNPLFYINSRTNGTNGIILTFTVQSVQIRCFDIKHNLYNSLNKAK